ncbi:TPA: hypothetical protein ACH3X2_006312 [Trebouxia sp. C0005]
MGLKTVGVYSYIVEDLDPSDAAFKQAGGYAKFREGASSMLWIGVACKNTCSVTNKNFDLTCRHSYGGHALSGQRRCKLKSWSAVSNAMDE